MSTYLSAVAMFVLICSTPVHTSEFVAQFPDGISRDWIGPQFWANRLQDWRLNQGRMECRVGDQPMRNVHVLTHSLGTQGAVQIHTRFGKCSWSKRLGKDDWAGFLIGSGDPSMDYRARALIFNTPGKNAGIIAALDGDGWLVFLDANKGLQPLPTTWTGDYHLIHENDDLSLSLRIEPESNTHNTLILELRKTGTAAPFQQAITTGVPNEIISGNLALTTQYGLGQDGDSYWFDDWTASGERLLSHPKQAASPIVGALYAISQNTLRVTAQLQAIGAEENHKVTLEIQQSDTTWQHVSSAEICTPGWFATMTIPNWRHHQDRSYRIVYKGDTRTHYFHGIIRKEPAQKEDMTIAAFTGNNNFAGSYDQVRGSKRYNFTRENMWFPHTDITSNVLTHEPDLLVFTGDQIYEHRPTKADDSGKPSSYRDYLYKWTLFYWAYNDLLRNHPTICLIDDHDIWQINLWGKGGAASLNPAKKDIPKRYHPWRTFMYRHDQGYILPGKWINMVESSQMDHLPRHSNEPLLQGILPRYGRVEYGGISFALLEDRKHKSSPLDFVPESLPMGGHMTNKEFNIKDADTPHAKLYGDKQLAFIDEWAADWSHHAQMKIVLSQTILTNLQTGAGVLKQYPNEGMRVDFDSAGWPQTGRRKAISAIRKGFAFVIAGDQHLGSIVHHGLEEWQDSGWSFCVPAIGNQAPRRWTPSQAAVSGHQDGMPRYTGNYYDAFQHKVTVWAASNPWDVDQEPGSLHDRATGYGIVHLNKKTQAITMECWPRYADPADKQQQYEGWPKTISLSDNYGRKAFAYLPELASNNTAYRPVVQVINEANKEIVYTIRVPHLPWKPKVFADGTYTVIVGEPETKQLQTFTNLSPQQTGNQQILLQQ